MSAAGIFTLITNDGKQDRMLMATDLLRKRLQQIAGQRMRAGFADPTPMLVDIEKTHVLFMNAHFKPFAAIGYEYNKVRPSAGSVTLGNVVRFSIPQFGDFFHDMVLHARLTAVTAASGSWRWCAYPGERLLKKVSFTVNGNPLDEYHTSEQNFYRKFQVPAGKLSGYNRCAGQQETKKAALVPRDASGGAISGAAPAATFGHIGSDATQVSGISNVLVDITTGYQTVKLGTTAGHANTGASGALGTASNHQRTDILEVTMPLNFWFNKDPRLAIPSVAIPFGQRFVDIELAEMSTLAQGVLVEGGSATGAGDTNFSTAAASLTTSDTVPVCDLYVNNIFVNPEVHDIFIRRIGFNLIRVHRRQVTRVNDATNGEVLLSSFKWPLETMFVGLRKAAQGTASADLQYLDGWHMFSDVQPQVSSTNSVVSAIQNPTDTNVTALDVSNAQYQWNEQAPLLQKLTIKAQGIPIYNDIPAVLFNQYLPLQYGSCCNIVTPDDVGAYMATFCLYPGVYQPSGHINVSRAREFYLEFDDTAPSNGRNLAGQLVDSTYSADLYVSGSCINFLLVSDGSAVLRYST